MSVVLQADTVSSNVTAGHLDVAGNGRATAAGDSHAAGAGDKFCHF